MAAGRPFALPGFPARWATGSSQAAGQEGNHRIGSDHQIATSHYRRHVGEVKLAVDLSLGCHEAMAEAAPFQLLQACALLQRHQLDSW